MDSPFLLIGAIFGLAALYVVPLVVLEVHERYRGTKALICPGTDRTALIKMDVRHAAVTAAYGRPDLRIVDCSRWPGHEDCDRGCLRKI